MSEHKLQAKHISDVFMLQTIKFISNAKDGSWVMTWELQRLMPHVPYKVVVAKCRQLIKRKLITGCPCGCRGDFEVTDKGAAFVKASYLYVTDTPEKRKARFEARVGQRQQEREDLRFRVWGE